MPAACSPALNSSSRSTNSPCCPSSSACATACSGRWPNGRLSTRHAEASSRSVRRMSIGLTRLLHPYSLRSWPGCAISRAWRAGEGSVQAARERRPDRSSGIGPIVGRAARPYRNHREPLRRSEARPTASRRAGRGRGGGVGTRPAIGPAAPVLPDIGASRGRQGGVLPPCANSACPPAPVSLYPGALLDRSFRFGRRRMAGPCSALLFRAALALALAACLCLVPGPRAAGQEKLPPPRPAPKEDAGEAAGPDIV